MLKATKHKIIAITGWLACFKLWMEDVKYYVQSFTVLAYTMNKTACEVT